MLENHKGPVSLTSQSPRQPLEVGAHAEPPRGAGIVEFEAGGLRRFDNVMA
jgi:hypothetical protein